MFRSAIARLTAWYLLIILMISLFFSSFVYVSSPREVREGLRQGIRQGQMMDVNGPMINLEDRRETVATSIRHRLLIDLIEFNLLILIAGGAASYLMAKRTLRPIEEAMEAQSRFAADASHELRTPLTAMRSEIEVALRDPKLGKREAVDLLKSNLEEVAKLEGLSGGLLKLAQHDAADSLMEEVSVEEVVDEAIRRHQKAASQSHVTVSSGLLPDLIVRGEPSALTELVSILLDNAIKYSHSGGEVEITSERAGSKIRISVKDDGVGIKTGDLPQIFSRFYRADSSRSKANVEGYGLGLSIAQKIAHAHGGEIMAHSRPGEGSVFTVTLPAA